MLEFGGATSAMGHKQTCRDVRPTSALPPKTDSSQTSRHVRKVPKGDMGGDLRLNFCTG
jgi:hypothetical protein